MDKTETVPLLENRHVKELLAVMDSNNLQETADLLDIIAYVGAMERQLDAAVNELKTMRRELAAMREESHPVKTALQNAVKALEKSIVVMREQLNQVKQSIIEGCKTALDAFKEKGLSALRNVAAFFKLRPALEALRDDLNNSIRLDEAAIAKIEAVSAEYHEAGRHLKNMGRALIGKEAVTEAKTPGGLAAALAAPFRAERTCLIAARRHVKAAIGSLDRLEKAERKPPIMETIKSLNEQIAQAKKDAPAVERPRPISHDGR